MANNQVQTQPKTITTILANEAVKKRFQDILGAKSASFISSIVSATKSNPKLADCNPDTVISSAVIAATLDLPIQSNLGFAYIVPYGKDATFQMGYKGYVQLAIRTGQYQTINSAVVYEGELIKENRFTGEFTFDSSQKVSDKIIGYVAYFKLVTGFEKTLYMTAERAEAHAKKYSQTYKSGFGKWKEDFEAMALKTVLKLLLSKYGILSVEMQVALKTDQAVIRDADTIDVEYVDNTPTEIDVEDLKALYELKKESVPAEEQIHIDRILQNKEVKSYPKVYKALQTL